MIVFEAGDIPADLLEFFEPLDEGAATDVFRIPTAGFPGSHYATFPPELARRCLRAGCPLRVCARCGAPWARETRRIDQGWDGSRYGERAVAATGGAKDGGTARSTLGSSNGRLTGKHETLGWRPTCACDAGTVPGVVLDCFSGSGTTPMVAVEEGRRWLACDLDPRAVEWTRQRLDGRQIRIPLDLAGEAAGG